MDFFIEIEWQRRGLGIQLFRAMMEEVGIEKASQLGFDRPSAKMFPFLEKHFGLSEYVPQETNMVVFEDYFR